MTDHASRPVVPGLFPEPKSITVLQGETDLSHDVRLVTNNVLPLQRKAMRGILTAASVKVVANKKKYIIEARVEPKENFDIAHLPEISQDEYYELEVNGSTALIRTPSQAGALWGTQTLGAIYRAMDQGATIPNLFIRDWPVMGNRGIFVENKWGPDRMLSSDWCEVIDRLSALKMNRLGVGLYGCWGNCRFEGQPTEFLMVPVPGHEELCNEHKLRWYSPKDGEWQEETYVARMAQDDSFGSVVEYGLEKGVTVIPFVNSLGHNTLIPRLLPEVSAKNADGSPTCVGYSIANPKTREFIEAFYGGIIERYYPEGIDFFHIQMDEVWPDYPDPEDPRKVGNPWCEAPESKKKTNEENLRDYILWLVGMLTDKGVGKVIMWNDQLTRHMDVLDGGFIKKLEDAGLKDRLIIHWWWYGNDALDDRTRVRIGRRIGLEGWVAPMTCYFNWSRYDFRRKNIEMMLAMAHEEGATGAVSYAVHDPGHTDHEALLAGCCWSGSDAGSLAEMEAKWAGVFGGQCERYLGAIEDLLRANDQPGLGLTYHYTYTYCGKDLPEWPRAYPGEALDKLEAIEGQDVAAALRSAASTAAEAKTAFLEIAAADHVTHTAEACVRSLSGDAARIQALGEVFAYLLETRAALRDGKDPKAAAKACKPVRKALVDCMATVEVGKPDWVVPATLQSLSVLLEFLDQLHGELKKGTAEPAWTVR